MSVKQPRYYRYENNNKGVTTREHEPNWRNIENYFITGDRMGWKNTLYVPGAILMRTQAYRGGLHLQVFIREGLVDAPL